MVIERRPGDAPAVAQDGASPLQAPTPYNVVIRIDDHRDTDAVTYMIDKAFGDGVEVVERVGGSISRRIWLEIGEFPREIAEARAEVVRRSAQLGRLGVGILIKKANS